VIDFQGEGEGEGVYAGWRVHTPSRVSPHSRGERGAGFVQLASTYSDYVGYSGSVPSLPPSIRVQLHQRLHMPLLCRPVQ
jgi:hypothetical protein